MPEDLYESPRSEMSQGDILEIVPNSHLKPPLTALFTRPDGLLVCQGEDHPDFKNKGQSIIATCRRERAMLITFDCEIDKPKMPNWIVSPVVPLSEFPGNAHSDIKKNKIFHLLYLPKYRDLLEDSVLVLNHTTTLAKEFVQQAKRVVSLSDDGRRAFYLQHFRWLTRLQLTEMRCPNCTAVFNAIDGASVRPD